MHKPHIDHIVKIYIPKQYKNNVVPKQANVKDLTAGYDIAIGKLSRPIPFIYDSYSNIDPTLKLYYTLLQHTFNIRTVSLPSETEIIDGINLTVAGYGDGMHYISYCI